MVGERVSLDETFDILLIFRYDLIEFSDLPSSVIAAYDERHFREMEKPGEAEK